MYLQFLCLLLVINVQGTLGTLITVPKNAAQVAGNDTKFECQTNTTDVILWYLNDLNSKNTTFVVYNGTHVMPEFEKRFSVNSTDGHFDLIIRNTTHVDPGNYICVEKATQENASACYVVLEYGSPNCSLNITDPMLGDGVNMSCKVYFNGSAWLRPHLNWYHDGHLVANESNILFEPNLVVESDYSVVASLPRLLNYTCKIDFLPPNPEGDLPPNLAQNAPSVTEQWDSPQLDVLFGPVNTTITGEVPENRVIYFSTELNCTSDASPLPTYTWVSEKGQQLKGSVFHAKQPGWQNITCTASNIIHKQTYSDRYTITVNVYGPGLSVAAIAGIAVGCSVAVICLVIIAVCIRRWRRQWNPHRLLESEPVSTDGSSYGVVA